MKCKLSKSPESKQTRRKVRNLVYRPVTMSRVFLQIVYLSLFTYMCSVHFTHPRLILKLCMIYYCIYENIFEKKYLFPSYLWYDAT